MGYAPRTSSLNRYLIYLILPLSLRRPHMHLVEWAIATHDMYESPFCVGNVHSLSYFQFQGIDGLYMSYKQRLKKRMTMRQRRQKGGEEKTG